MEDFERELEAATAKGAPKVAHGVIVTAIDKTGKYIYKRCAGTTAVDGSTPVSFDNTLALASCSKLITTLAALQCVERGQITLDEPVDKYLPEIGNPKIITYDEITSRFALSLATSKITLRQLLTHSSGVGYDVGSPALTAWRAFRGEAPLGLIGTVIAAFSTPLMFEPGTSWTYGGGVDWAGILISRLNNMTLEAYLREHIFTPLGMTNTTFHALDPSYLARFISPSVRDVTGKLWPGFLPYPWPAHDEFGGHGLMSSVPDFMAVLHDLIADKPKTLSREMMDLFFTPQFDKGSPTLRSLYANRNFFVGNTGGPLGNLKVNHSIGGLLIQEHNPMTGCPPNTLAWSGLINTRFWANREEGVAGIYAVQVLPRSDPANIMLAASFQRAMWGMLEGMERRVDESGTTEGGKGVVKVNELAMESGVGEADEVTEDDGVVKENEVAKENDFARENGLAQENGVAKEHDFAKEIGIAKNYAATETNSDTNESGVLETKGTIEQNGAAEGGSGAGAQRTANGAAARVFASLFACLRSLYRRPS